MPEKRYIRAALRLALTVLALAALRWLVPCFLPLLLALAFSSLLVHSINRVWFTLPNSFSPHLHIFVYIC